MSLSSKDKPLIWEVFYTMIQLLKQMNAVLADWRVQFDPLSETNLAFRLTDRGEVFLNQYRLTRLPGLILVQAAIHADTIVFSFDANRFLEISLHWPEKKTPYIDKITWGYHRFPTLRA